MSRTKKSAPGYKRMEREKERQRQKESSSGSETSTSASSPDTLDTKKRKQLSSTSQEPEKKRRKSSASTNKRPAPHTPSRNTTSNIGSASSGSGSGSESAPGSGSEDEGSSDEGSGREEHDGLNKLAFRRPQNPDVPKANGLGHDEPARQPTQTQASRASSVASTSPPPSESKKYEPPPGFSLQTSSTSGSKGSAVSKLLSPENLKGKEIWYITVPASLPLSSIKYAALDHPKKGHVTVTHEGDDFSFRPEDATPYLLLPKAGEGSVGDAAGEGAKYEVRNVEWENICTLKRSVKKPEALAKFSVAEKSTGKSGKAKGEQGSASTEVRVKKTPQQPEGLRRRFWAVGFEEPAEKTAVVDGTAGKEGTVTNGSTKEKTPKAVQFEANMRSKQSLQPAGSSASESDSDVSMS